jgi:hypothetical protein
MLRPFTALAAFADEMMEVAILLREVEEARLREGPEALLKRLRPLGAKRAPRTLSQRQRLSRNVTRIDRLLHGESNCYRRSLVQVALDRDAASQPFVLGLDVPASGVKGHAWLEGNERAGFDVEFRL